MESTAEMRPISVPPAQPPSPSPLAPRWPARGVYVLSSLIVATALALGVVSWTKFSEPSSPGQRSVPLTIDPPAAPSPADVAQPPDTTTTTLAVTVIEVPAAVPPVPTSDTTSPPRARPAPTTTLVKPEPTTTSTTTTSTTTTTVASDENPDDGAGPDDDPGPDDEPEQPPPDPGAS